MKALKKITAVMMLVLMLCTVFSVTFVSSAATKTRVTKVELNKTSVTLYTTETCTLKATVSPSNATDKSVTWKSSDTSVATVSSSGKVTAKKAGSATITCTSKDRTTRRATCKVTVKTKVNVSSVKLNKSSLSMYTTQTATLKATVNPSNASVKDLKWSSSDTKVATVSSSGKVTAKKKGTATITCVSKDNSKKKATCKITVTTKVNVKSVKLDASSVSIVNGKTKKLTATVSPSNASVATVKWKTSNSKVATVSTSGRITAVGVGTATITCTSTDNSEKKATCKVTVTPVKVSSVKLSSTSVTVYPEKTVTLTATVSPSNAANKGVTWKTSSSKIATVSSKGVVTGVKAGTAIITCTAKDGSGKKATCKVTVGIPVESVKLKASETSKNAWYIGYSSKLTVSVSPSTATNKGITWTSSAPDCVSVDSNGKVTVIKQKTYKNWLNQTKVDSDQTVTITATSKYNSNIKDTYQLTIVKNKVPVKGVSISTTNTNDLWLVGKEYIVTGTVITDDGAEASNPKINYSSSNKKIATVSSNGVVKILKAGEVTIKATSADDETKTSALTITAIKPTLSVDVKLPTKAETPSPYDYAAGEYILLMHESNLEMSVIRNKLGGLKYEVEDPDTALVTQTEGYTYATIKFLKASTVKVRVSTGDGSVVSGWTEISVADIKIDNDFFENVKAGDTLSLNAYLYNGKDQMTDSGLDIFCTTPYSELRISDDGKSVYVTDELSDGRAYIEVRSSDGRIGHSIYLISGKYTIPTSKSSRLSLMKRYSTEMYTDSFIANYSRRINFEDLVTDKKNSSTELRFDWGILKDLDLSGLMDLVGGTEDDVSSDINDLDFVESLYGEDYIETSASVQKDKCPKPLTVSSDAVKSISVKNSGSTYTIKMTLNAQDKMLPDAVTTSEYAKTMPVIDKAYLDNYIATFSQIDGVTDGDESIAIKSISYGTVNQTYKNGYVEYTVDKFYDKVVKAVYHYDSNVDVKNAKLNLEAGVDDIDIVMKINIKAAFTMNVDNTLVLGDIVY